MRRYLEAVEAHRPKRGRKRTAESIKRQLDSIDQKLKDADALTRVNLIQQRMDLNEELSAMENKVDLRELEDGFVNAAREYGERKGISYAAWREAGVDPAVLKRAGIKRGR